MHGEKQRPREKRLLVRRDPKSVAFEKNWSLTKEEVGAYWRAKKKAGEEHPGDIPSSPDHSIQRVQGIRCSFSTTDKKYGNNVNKREIKTRSNTPQILKLAVGGVTELLRLFSSRKNRLETMSDTKAEKISVSDVDDVVMILKCDNENAYFVTGAFTSSIYAEDCMFEDPTIRFRGFKFRS